jgi:hypothetical protein
MSGRRLNRNVSIRLSNLNDEIIGVADIPIPDNVALEMEQEYTIQMFQSTGRVTSTPAELLDRKVSLISTDHAYIYTL